MDILEKLPVPFGLVRFGVAPDHPEVKVRQFNELPSSVHVESTLYVHVHNYGYIQYVEA